MNIKLIALWTRMNGWWIKFQTGDLEKSHKLTCLGNKLLDSGFTLQDLGDEERDLLARSVTTDLQFTIEFIGVLRRYLLPFWPIITIFRIYWYIQVVQLLRKIHRENTILMAQESYKLWEKGSRKPL